MRAPAERPRARAAAAFALVLALAASAAFAQFLGQPGKDVVWVPTPEALVEKMLEMAKVRKNDFVVDLGSGDGRIAIAAAKKFGARSLGIEYDAAMVALSNRLAADAGVSDRVQFLKADIFETDFSQASVVTLYLLPELNLKLRPRLLAMRPGTRIVSHRFDMDDWEPDETVWAETRQAHLWIVPARVEGAWSLRIDAPGGAVVYELSLRQSFQKIAGELKQGMEVKLFEAKILGDTMAFTISDAGRTRLFAGRIRAEGMSGVIRTAGFADLTWSAARR